MKPPDGRADVGAAAAERWRTVQQLVDAALDLPPPERTAYLRQACATDPTLLDEAARLLAACERAARAPGLLAGSAANFAAPLLTAADGAEVHPPEPGAAVPPASLATALAGRYTVERELGRGGMATVYLARDLRHDRPVAVKVLDRGIAGPGAERFLHEIRTAARLTHPHVVGLHDSGDAEGLLYYVMPYVEGETLRARLARAGALPLPDALRLLRELADALAYAHGRGVVHRDLKPENVLLSGGHALVADFGIAKALAAARRDADARRPGAGLTRAGVALGTPAYMAPEQALGDPDTDHRADLYALGVIAYEMLAGAHPFGARHGEALVRAHLSEAPAPIGQRRPGLPPALAALVMELRAKDRTARPQSAEAVLRVLDALTTAPLAAPRRRRRALALLAAGIVVVLASGGGWALWRRGAPPAVPSSASAPPRAAAPSGAAPAAPSAIRTLAVLPFENTSGSTADDYFSDGMTDELAHALTHLPGLRVAGRTSSYAFKGKAVAAQEIGRALDVGAIVTGTVRRAGARLRLTAQLVGTTDGKVLWDSVYETRSSDVFAVQDQFTRAIVAAVTPALGEAGGRASPVNLRRGTADEEAYDLYLKGHYYWLQRGAANLTRSIAYFKQALARDPAFARAEAGLAMAYAELPVYLAGPADSAAALAMASARRAVALDSTLADAQLALGFALDLQLRFREALARYRAGVALDPGSATGHHWLGFSLLNLGYTDEAVAEMRRASELDPLATAPASAVGFALLFARRFPAAAAAARHALDLDSTFGLAPYELGLAQAFGGHPFLAVRTLVRAIRLHPGDSRLTSALVFANAAAGRWGAAARLRARLHAPGGDVSGGGDAAIADLVFGDPAPLVRLLSTEAGQRRFVDMGNAFGCNPLLDPLWSEARFRAAMRALTVQPCPLVGPWPFRTGETSAAGAEPAARLARETR